MSEPISKELRQWANSEPSDKQINFLRKLLRSEWLEDRHMESGDRSWMFASLDQGNYTRTQVSAFIEDMVQLQDLQLEESQKIIIAKGLKSYIEKIKSHETHTVWTIAESAGRILQATKR